MMTWIVLAFGLVLIVEGLVFALAPLRIEDLLQALKSVSRDQRRAWGLMAVALGAILVWVARLMGAF